MKKTKAFLLVFLMIVIMSLSIHALSFTDTHDHWAKHWIDVFSDKGYVYGYPDKLFRPDKKITADEADTILTRFGAPDIILNLGSENAVTREKAIAYIAQAIEKVSGTKPDISDVSLTFSDSDTIESWAEGYAKELIKYGTLQGYPDKTVRGKNAITRAEFVKLLYENADVTASYTVSGSLVGLPNAEGATVTYTIDGVSGSVVIDSATSYLISVPKGADIVITAPSRSGYTVSPSKYEIDNVTSDITGRDFVYTNIPVIMYNVMYNANGGTGSHTDNFLSYGTSYTVKNNLEAGILHENFVFIKWNTAADGTGTSYQSGDTVNITSDLALYAQWVQEKSRVPVINQIMEGEVSVTGTGIPGSHIEVIFHDGTDMHIVVKADGKWHINVPAGFLKVGDVVSATQTEPEKTPSDIVHQTVIADSTIHPSTDIYVENLTAGLNHAIAGDVLLYDAIISNNGNPSSTWRNAYVTLYLDSTVSLQESSIRINNKAVTSSQYSYDSSENALTLYPGDIKGGFGHSVSFRVTVNSEVSDIDNIVLDIVLGSLH